MADPTELRELIARAIYGAHSPRVSWDALNPAVREWVRVQADAALELIHTLTGCADG